MTMGRRIVSWWTIIPNGGVWGILAVTMFVSMFVGDGRYRDSTAFRMHIDRVDIGIRRRGFAF
jgi:hypothetical protein